MNKEEAIFDPVSVVYENSLSEFDRIELERLEEERRPWSDAQWAEGIQRFSETVIPVEGRFIDFETQVQIKPKSKKHYASGKHYKAH